jgi:hypothetical protein
MGGGVVDAVGPAARLTPVRAREGTDGIDRVPRRPHVVPQAQRTLLVDDAPCVERVMPRGGLRVLRGGAAPGDRGSDGVFKR